jgi:hypothetical protein
MYFTKNICVTVLSLMFTLFSIVGFQRIQAAKVYDKPKDLVPGASAIAEKIAAGELVSVYVRISEHDLRQDRKLRNDEIEKAKDALKKKMQSVGVRSIEEEEGQPVLKMILAKQVALEQVLEEKNVVSLAYAGIWQAMGANSCSTYPIWIVNGLSSPETSDYAPDFAFFKDAYYVAWTGRDNVNGGKHLNVQPSTFYWPDDGHISWGVKKTFYSGSTEARSEDGTKLMATDSRLWLTWRSIERKRIFLMSSSNGVNWAPGGGSRRVTYQGNYQTTDYAPAMAFFKNKYYIAWTGRDTQNGGKHLNVMRGDLSTDGTKINWTNKKTFYSGPTQAQSNESPALLATAERLYLVWRGRDDHKIRYMHTTDGINWQGKTRLSIKSEYGPDLEFYNNKFYLAWSDEDETFGQVYVMEGTAESSGTINWGNKCRYDATKHRPALVKGFGDLHLAWRAWYTQGRFFYYMKLNDAGDFGQVSATGADVLLSTGHSFKTPQPWTGAGYGSAPKGWYVGDFDGDGMDDIFRYMPGQSGAEVFLSSGAEFGIPESWTGAGYGYAPNGWYVGDFDGDGKDDIFRYCPSNQPCGSVRSGAEVFISTGSSFRSEGDWTGAGYGYAPNGWYVGDFDGDGKDDIFRYCPSNQPCGSVRSGAEVFISTGSSFRSEGDWTGAGYGYAPNGWYVGDFDGDGKDDIFRYIPSNI